MSIRNAQELKALESRLTKLQSEKKAIDAEFAEVAGRQSKLAQQIQSARQDIDALKTASSDVIVTEHAIIRFMERAMGLDLDQIKSRILTEAVKAMAQKGNGKYPIGVESLKAVVRDGSIVTVE